MNTNKNKPEDTVWNNQKQKSDLNEGFSGENIPDDYNPSEHVKETETDASGNTRIVDRARDADKTSESEKGWNSDDAPTDLKGVERGKISGKEDFNYGETKPRLNTDHPENKRDRGNMHLDE